LSSIPRKKRKGGREEGMQGGKEGKREARRKKQIPSMNLMDGRIHTPKS
jgi:hypothetical protein